MIASLKSEVIRFRRTALIGGAVLVTLTLLITMFLFIGIDAENGPGRGAPPGAAGNIDLEGAGGVVAGLQSSGTIVGIVALALFALSVARDYEYGTIRVLLIGQPRRGSLLAGKLFALTLMVAGAAAVAAAGSILLSLAIAGPTDVDSSAWAASEAISGSFNFVLGSVGWGLFGATLAMLTRSASTAITAGVAYLLVGENLLGLIWDAAPEWLPAGALQAFTAGGTAAVSYARSSVLLAVYVAGFAAIMYLVFQRRDIVD